MASSIIDHDGIEPVVFSPTKMDSMDIDAISPIEWQQFANNMQVFDPIEMQRLAKSCNPKLLRKFFSLDMATQNLHEAARLGKNDVMKVLLKLKSTDVNKLDNARQTALHYATREGHLNIVSSLLEDKNIDTNLCDEDGNTALHIALERDHVLIFDKILKAPRVDVNSTNKKGETALILAAGRGHEKLVDMLLKEPNVMDILEKHKNTPLHAAAEHGHANIVEKLLKKIDVNTTSHHKKKFALHLAKEGGHEAPRNGHAVIVEKLLGKIDVNSTTHKEEKSPLHLAVEGGHKDVVDLLLGVSIVNPSLKDSGGNTPLHIAAQKGNEVILEKLLQMPKVDVNSTNLNKKTALHLAAFIQNANITTKLLEVPNVDPCPKMKDGTTPLHMAAKYGGVDVAQVLLAKRKRKVDVNIIDSTYKRTAVHWASQRGHLNVVDVLLKVPNVDPYLGDDNDNTPLHLAAKFGHRNVAERLLAEPYLDMVNKVNKQNETPLFLAAKHGFEDVVDFLMENPKINLSICDEHGDSPFHIAVKGDHDKIAEKLFTHPSIVPIHANKEDVTGLHLCIRGGYEKFVDMLLKKSPLDAIAKDAYGNFPIHYAAQNGDICILQMILNALGVDENSINSVNNHLETPLHIAVKEGHVAVVKLLVRKQTLNASMGDRDGNSALHVAVKYNEEEIVKILLEVKGVDVNAKNKVGFTALVLAAEGGHVHIFNILLAQVQDVQNNEGGRSVEEGQRKPSTSDWGVHSLVLAARNGHITIIKSLLAHGIDVNATHELQQYGTALSALHAAIKHRHPKVVEVLLQDSKIDPNRRNGNEEHPLFIAAKHGHIAIIKMLMATRKIGVNVLSNHETALHGAAEVGSEHVVKALLKTPGIDVHIRNVDGETALFHAARANNKTILKDIYEKSKVNIASEKRITQTQLKIDDKNDKGVGIIHLAAQGNLLNVIDFLLDIEHNDARSVDVNLKTSPPKSQKDGFIPQSALEIAIKEQHYTIVEKLTKFDSISFILEKDGKTVLQQIFDQQQWETFNIVRRTDEVSDYIEALYKDRQASVDAANAILVGAALIAGVTFASWLQPPLGYSTYYHEQFLDTLPAPPVAYPEYVAFDHHPSLQAFWVFNSLSFFSAIATVISGARSVLPTEKLFIKKEVEILRWNLLTTSILLGFSMFFVLLAFATAGVIVLPPMMKFRANIFSTIAIGGSVCFLFLFLFGRSIVKLGFDIKSSQISKKGFSKPQGLKPWYMTNPFTTSKN